MAQFHVICLETQETLKDEHGKALVFSSGPEAAMHANAHTTSSGKKHQPRPIKDDAWIDREAKRLEDGTYTRVPWDYVGAAWGEYSYDALGHSVWVERKKTLEDCKTHDDWWYTRRKAEAEHHYAHVSQKHPGKVAFTETPEKGAQDIQATMNVGRYLTRFYDLPESNVRDYANQFLAKYGELQLRFADTADEIERVYVNGPRSCMSYERSSYESSIHPTRVYAAGDLAVAYLTAADDEEHITSRVLCWPEKKTYGRVYGDEKIETFLDGLGYSQHDDFASGARMLKILEDGCYVVPYVDALYGADDCGKFLRIRHRGEVDCETTTGLSGYRGTCENCGDHYDDENEGGYIDSLDQRWCQHCYENHSFYCEMTSRQIANSDGIRMADGDLWSERRFEREGGTCDATGDNYHMDELVSLHDGTLWHVDYFEEHGRRCSHCDECVSNDDPKCDACGEPENPEAIEDQPRERHPRQGRDEHPDQLELTLERPNLALQARVGDLIYLAGDTTIPDGWHPVTAVDERLTAGTSDGLRLSVRARDGSDEHVYDRCVTQVVALETLLQAAE